MRKEKQFDIVKETEIIERIDMVNKNLANIRSDIAVIVHDVSITDF